jgi:hypothetical protein
MNLIDSLNCMIELASARKKKLQLEIKSFDQYTALVNKNEMVQYCQQEIDLIDESSSCLLDFLQDLRRLERSTNNAIESSTKIANKIGIIFNKN